MILDSTFFSQPENIPAIAAVLLILILFIKAIPIYTERSFLFNLKSEKKNQTQYIYIQSEQTKQPKQSEPKQSEPKRDKQTKAATKGLLNS